MVFSQSQNSDSDQAKPSGDKKDLDFWQVIAVIAGALIFFGAISGWFSARNLAHFQYNHFDEIYLALVAVGIALTGVLASWLSRSTENLASRVRRLKPIWDHGAGILAGKTINDPTPLYVPDHIRTGHVQVIAATGRGKTESVIFPWAARDLHRGRSVILIDGKGDPRLAARLEKLTQGMPTPPEVRIFDLGNLQASCTINPLENGSPQQIVDRLFTAFQFQDEYYQAVQYDIAGAAVALIQEVDGADGRPGVVTFKRLYEILTDDQVMNEAIAKSSNEAIKGLLNREYLHVNAKDRPQLIKGLISQIGPFATREVAAVVNGPNPAKPGNHCSLSELLLSDFDTQRVFIFLIPTLKYQKLGAQLGKIILQELGWAVGEREGRYGDSAPFTPVFLDEFSAFVYEGFENILNKARSSQTALHLSHQSIGDFSKISDSLPEIINVNTNTKCLLGLNDPKTAEFFAKHIGTVTTAKLTEKAEAKNFFGIKRKTGDLSMREVEEFIIHPNRLKNYTQGRGVLHMPGKFGNVTEEIQFAAFDPKEV